MPAAARGDVRNIPNAMAKIRKNVGKAKEVLSANEEYQASHVSACQAHKIPRRVFK